MVCDSKPLVYSCSGCSNVAQLANDVALALDKQSSAQMSCIAGVGGHVKGLVKLAKSGRPIIALDGCQLHCVKACLNGVNLDPDIHVTLTEEGEKKRKYEQASHEEVMGWCERITDMMQAGLSEKS